MALIQKSRIISAIRAAFLADAASMGTHWIYDPKEMAKTVPSIEKPEFRDPPKPSYYSSKEFPGHYEAGMLSPYGEQLLFVTEHCASKREVDAKDMAEEMLSWAETFGGRPDSALGTFVNNMKEGKTEEPGADDKQAHAYMKVIPVTCLYAGHPDLKARVEAAIRVHQNNDVAVRFGLTMSTLLEAILMGSTLEKAIEKAVREIDDEEVLKASNQAKATDADSLEDLLLEISHSLVPPDSPFYDLAGRSCLLPGSFVAPMYQLYKIVAQDEAVDEDTYIEAIRNNILVAGDTCSRAIMLGAILGAAADSVPGTWLEKMDAATMAKVDAAAEAIADHALSSCPAQ